MRVTARHFYQPVLLCVTLLAPLTAKAGRGASFQSRPASQSGFILHYRIMGKGPTVLLLSGGPGFSSDYLLPVAARLSSHYSCLLVDQRGTGKSQLDRIDSTTLNVRTILEDLESLRQNLKIERWTVFGHSWGGIVGMLYASRYPTRTRALVLVGSGGIDLEFIEYFHNNVQARLSKEDRDLEQSISDVPGIAKKDRQLETMKVDLAAYFADRKLAPAITGSMNFSTYSPAAAEQCWMALFDINYDLRSQLKDFRAPVLQIQGEEDPIGKRTALKIHDTLARSRMEFLQHCGHFPWVEREEAFFSVLDDFLKKLEKEGNSQR